ncbi:hypothetical protein Daus18300_005662 [Diaporthe australafricana]|uniref:Cystathionine gamma-synthase n=1 Tax=Diaporthe australafricana TaxID=127596 RepID=A0ABR3X0B0_9PEZI
MSAKITTAFGEAVPPAPRHSVTAHMGGWETVERYGANSSSVIACFNNAYPRMRPHWDIAQLSEALLVHIDAVDSGCFLFSSIQSATECVEYSVSAARADGNGKEPVSEGELHVRAFKAKDFFYAVIFPESQRTVVAGFWSTPGSGVSSRFAEANLDQLETLKEISYSDIEVSKEGFEGPIYEILGERVVSYLERAPLNPSEPSRPSTKDVYFFPTGMAAIYKPHTYLLKSSEHRGSTVLFGMAVHEHPHGEDLCALEEFLREEHEAHRKVQAIWAEFPANPLLVTPDLSRLRELADKYDIILGIDDTIGSWANIDITAMADIVVTSVTKSFNGYADVIAGSAILNPASPRYHGLKQLFKQYYVPELYVADAETIERNSRDYLARTTRLNHNASALVRYLQSCVENPQSSVLQVHYPSINPSRHLYERFKRPVTEDFTPGYGCLFSVEFESLAQTRAFYDNLNVHKSVHLGAPVTLAFAYTMCTYKKKLDWAAKYGMRPTQIRITAGLEDTETLLEDFSIAVKAADNIKHAPAA